MATKTISKQTGNSQRRVVVPYNSFKKIGTCSNTSSVVSGTPFLSVGYVNKITIVLTKMSGLGYSNDNQKGVYDFYLIVKLKNGNSYQTNTKQYTFRSGSSTCTGTFLIEETITSSGSELNWESFEIYAACSESDNGSRDAYAFRDGNGTITITYEGFEGSFKYYNKSNWQNCSINYYDGTKWVQVQPHYYENGLWKPTGA